MHSVAIVEDHPVMRETLAMLLGRDPGLEIVRLCGTAEEALADLQEVTPDIVLVDVSLPGMSGIELIARLVSERPKLKCLVISGHNALVYLNKARSAGALGFVSKDRPGEVMEAVKAVLEGGDFWHGDGRPRR